MTGRIHRILLAATILATLALPVRGEEASYRLGPQDKVRVRVTEWRADRGEAFVWEALSGEFAVDAAGRISLPLVGTFEVAGLSAEEVGTLLGDRLQRKVGLVRKPDASVEVAQFRPVYVVGQVDKPGAYAFRPQLTVLQAVSLAGGLYRPGDLGLQRLAREGVSARGDLREVAAERAALLARRARLDAERRGDAAIVFPDELADGRFADAVGEERALFDTRRNALRSQLAALAQTKEQLNAEIETLQAKAATQDRQIALAKKELGNINGLVERGLAINPRLLALEQSVAQLESSRLDSQLAISRARQDLSRTDRTALDLKNQQQSTVLVDLRETQMRLSKLQLKADTLRGLLTDTEVVAPRLIQDRLEAQRRPVIFTLVRAGSGRTEEEVVGEMAPLRPGDVLKVSAAPIEEGGPRPDEGKARIEDGQTRPQDGKTRPLEGKALPKPSTALPRRDGSVASVQ